MSSNRNLIILLIYLSLILSSCITNKKLIYIQHEGKAIDTITVATQSDYKIQPYDNLFVRVIIPDPQLSAMFNTTPTMTASFGISEQSADLISYPVEADGTIKLPYAGRVTIAGLTIYAATIEIEQALKTYIADASVMLKIVNNYISLIGEVQKPGRYPIYKNRLSIFQALALGGDLTDFSNRKKVQLIRQTRLLRLASHWLTGGHNIRLLKKVNL